MKKRDSPETVGFVGESSSPFQEILGEKEEMSEDNRFWFNCSWLTTEMRTRNKTTGDSTAKSSQITFQIKEGRRWQIESVDGSGDKRKGEISLGFRWRL